MPKLTIDEYWMREALGQAKRAAQRDEVPVGAVLVDLAGELIASGHNQPISALDPTAHAEIVVIREAAKLLKNYRLPGTTLYVTIEPCAMCVGALVHARVSRIVFGALEPKTGAIQSAHRFFESAQFNHYPQVLGGVLDAECADLISKFFRQKRERKKSGKLAG
jgi:tRNA(Arg) A34 adenosine deaminase TadA